MSNKSESVTPPVASVEDKFHALAKAGIGSIPLVGAAATELFQMLVTPPLEVRRQNWMNSVAEALRDLQASRGIDLELLSSNDHFIDAVMQASTIALRTSNSEKRNALRNAILNAAMPHAIDELRQQIYLTLVDVLTYWHIRVLHLFADPVKWFRENHREVPQYPMTSSLSRLLVDAYPELAQQRELYDQLAKDLFDRGLINTNGLHTMMSADGAFENRVTALGSGFLKYITAPC
jgi:hypothetical protein